MPTADPTSSAKREIATTSALLTGFTEAGLITKPSADNVALAAGQFKQLKVWQGELEKKEKAITGPINEALKQVRALFKPTKERLESLIDSVRNGIDRYNRDAKAVLDAKQERLEEKVDKGTLSERSADIKLARAQAQSNVDVIPTRKHKVVHVTDEAKVPDEYWIIDWPSLRAAALKADKQKKKIPGVVVEEEELVVNR